jgi:hypothetical protein
MVTVQQVAVIPFQKNPAFQVLLIRKLPDGLARTSLVNSAIGEQTRNAMCASS